MSSTAPLMDCLVKSGQTSQVRHSDKDADQALFLRIKKMGTDIDDDGQASPCSIDTYDPEVWPVLLPCDSKRHAGIFNYYLQYLCSVWHDLPNGIQPSDEVSPAKRLPDSEEVNNSGYYAEGRESIATQELPDNEAPVIDDDETNDFPYTFVELQNRYEINDGWVGMPIADNDPDADRSMALIKLHASMANQSSHIVDVI